MHHIAKILLTTALTFLFAYPDAEGRKIRQSLKINKVRQSPDDTPADSLSYVVVSAEEPTTLSITEGDEMVFNPDSIRFSGYEKEANANVESFITVNNGVVPVSGIEIRIDYLDMKGRMLHSRTVSIECRIPGKEARKLDIPTWDRQHTYFYYLGNEPRKVATPYKVAITPVTFRLLPGHYVKHKAVCLPHGLPSDGGEVVD